MKYKYISKKKYHLSILLSFSDKFIYILSLFFINSSIYNSKLFLSLFFSKTYKHLFKVEYKIDESCIFFQTQNYIFFFINEKSEKIFVDI